MRFFSEGMRRDPYPLYAQVRGAAPVLAIPGTEIWLLLDHEDVKRALADADTFSSDMTTAGRTNPGWFIFFDPPRHTKLRALVLRAFTPRVVAGLEPRVRALSQELLDAVVERGEMDLVRDFAVPLPTRVITELLGLPARDLHLFKQWTDILLGLANSVEGPGHGGHFCLGAALSRLEARVGVGDLLRRCAGLARASDEPWVPRQAFHVHGPSALPVTFTPAR